MLHLVVNFDGGGSSAGGPGAWGVVVKESGTTVSEFSGWHPDCTNNEAEYMGLIAALRAGLRYSPLASIVVRGDSQLVIRQVTGKFRCKKQALVPYRDLAQRLIAQYPVDVVLEWVPREQNKRADRLSGDALKVGRGVVVEGEKQPANYV